MSKAISFDDLEKLQEENERLREVVLFGLSLIALAEQFDIDLGNGWRNFRRMAKDAGVEYQFANNENKSDRSATDEDISTMFD